MSETGSSNGKEGDDEDAGDGGADAAGDVYIVSVSDFETG